MDNQLSHLRISERLREPSTSFACELHNFIVHKLTTQHTSLTFSDGNVAVARVSCFVYHFHYHSVCVSDFGQLELCCFARCLILRGDTFYCRLCLCGWLYNAARLLMADRCYCYMGYDETLLAHRYAKNFVNKVTSLAC